MILIHKLFDHFLEFNMTTVTIRIFMATILGGMIGLDRGLKKRPAGLRTFSLVCLGSALAMITNEYLLYKHGVGDVARMASQVISGVGFLGAGTILVTGHNRVKGLTTAASLWATAAMGIAIGSGFYSAAIVGFIAILFSVTVLHILDEKLISNSRILELYLEIEGNETFLNILNYLNKSSYQILHFEKSSTRVLEKETAVLVELNLGHRMSHSDVIAEISLIEGVKYIEELK